MRFSTDSSWRRPESGDSVLAGSPVRAFRLTPAGKRIIEAIERGDDIQAGDNPLVDKLLDAGAIHPLPDHDLHGIDPKDITVVIPTYVDDPSTDARLASLVSGLSGVSRVIVIDDHSPVPLPTLTADSSEVLVVRGEVNGGPAAARNTGLSLVETSHVAFVDTDVVCSVDELTALGAWFTHPRTVAIAPRVRSIGGNSTIERYESTCSPLDAGVLPARVRPGSRVPYVPAAALLCRTDALRSVGGFDESMRTGEDVDLVWRLDAAGFHCRYEPAVEVGHHPRVGFAAFVAQRRGYGSSVSGLHRAHGGAVAPLRGTWTNIGAWTSVVIGLPIIGVSLAVVTAVRLARRLQFVPNAKAESVRIALRTHLRTGRNVADAITKVWWPIALVLALFSRRARVALGAAVLAPALVDWWNERPRLDPVRYVFMRVVDNASYGIGAWESAVRDRSVAALLPEVVSSSSTEG